MSSWLLPLVFLVPAESRHDRQRASPPRLLRNWPVSVKVRRGARFAAQVDFLHLDDTKRMSWCRRPPGFTRPEAYIMRVPVQFWKVRPAPLCSIGRVDQTYRIVYDHTCTRHQLETRETERASDVLLRTTS